MAGRRYFLPSCSKGCVSQKGIILVYPLSPALEHPYTMQGRKNGQSALRKQDIQWGKLLPNVAPECAVSTLSLSRPVSSAVGCLAGF